jgi:hypothetical protein
MTLTPSVRAISLCSLPCVARSSACASLAAISAFECFPFFINGAMFVPVLRLSQYHACITIAVWHFPLLERRGPRLERRGDPAGRARRRGRQCYRREVRILLCHARQGTASITAHVSASGKVPRPIIPSAAQGGAALLARRLHDNGLHEQRELGQSNMNCGLTKWFALLHDVKVRCGIERHDWALGSLRAGLGNLHRTISGISA